MSHEKEKKRMAVSKEDMNAEPKKQQLDRQQMIRSLTKQACKENDEGLSRLSKI